MRYVGTISSNGKQTTTQANQTFKLVQFPYDVMYLQMEAFGSPVHFTINDETNTHEVDINSIYVIKDIPIYKITIIENGIQYRYVGYVNGGGEN
jgi:hypothetical protein